jgi:hypothetical protein
VYKGWSGSVGLAWALVIAISRAVVEFVGRVRAGGEKTPAY